MSELSIGFVLFPNLTQLDFTGPLQVLSRLPNSTTHIAAKTRAPVPSDAALALVPTTTFKECPPIDLLCIPGGFGVDQAIEDEETMEFVRREGARARYVTSVCTGSFLLHGAGLCSGRRVTTHWRAIEELRARKDLTVLDDVRYVRDGNVVTASGVSAGIDMALWLVGQLWSPPIARRVQRDMQYDPAPPYAAEA